MEEKGTIHNVKWPRPLSMMSPIQGPYWSAGRVWLPRTFCRPARFWGLGRGRAEEAGRPQLPQGVQGS